MTAAPEPGMTRLAYTVKEVGAQLGKSRDVVIGLIRKGKLRARWTGRSYLIPVSALDEFLAGSDEPAHYEGRSA